MTKKLDCQTSPGEYRSTVWVAASVFLLIFGAILSWSAYGDYGDALEEEFRVLESQARLGDVQVAGALRSINLVLQSVSDDVQAISSLSPDIVKKRQLSFLRGRPEGS